MKSGLKLHLGCGNKVLPEFLNYDANPVSAAVVPWEAGQPLLDPATRQPLPDDGAELVVAHHLIEHIPHDGPRETAWFAFWAECWRVLRVGGMLDVVTPHGDSIWAWSDPGHVRAIFPETFIFIRADAYIAARNDPTNPMSPYEPRCNFAVNITLVPGPAQRMDGKVDRIANIHAQLTKLPLPPGYPREGRGG